MTWSAESLGIIQENLTFLKKRKWTKRLRDNGPTGKPWSKVQQRMKIFEVEVRKLREMAALLDPYPCLRKL